jgi:hypothetical protein
MKVTIQNACKISTNTESHNESNYAELVAGGLNLMFTKG